MGGPEKVDERSWCQQRMQGAGSGTPWKLERAAPNFTKLVQLERTADACCRRAQIVPEERRQPCAAVEGLSDQESFRREVVGTWALFSWDFERSSVGSRSMAGGRGDSCLDVAQRRRYICEGIWGPQSDLGGGEGRMSRPSVGVTFV